MSGKTYPIFQSLFERRILPMIELLSSEELTSEQLEKLRWLSTLKFDVYLVKPYGQEPGKVIALTGPDADLSKLLGKALEWMNVLQGHT
ncbi:hypothetical protein DES52_12225 [Deinococcus yavapaiensis KR-236]|uniref:Uncharacterized protein n=2 Tax=Deinococcus TaxID=1298 RepID=A0A318S281_9DEIO|nr:hypothetical protein DES52_12225 [Deinococcus yavapaiensis KR-236]